MRVYELSKQLGVPSKELIAALSDEGFQVQSHMAVLSPEAIDFLIKRYKEPAMQVQQPPKRSEKPLGSKQEPQTIQSQPPKLEEASKQKPTEPTKGEISHMELADSIQPSTARPSIKPVEIKLETTPLTIEPMTVGDFAQRSGKPVGEVILTLLKQGQVAGKNQVLSEKTIEQLATLYTIPVAKAEVSREGAGKGALSKSTGTGERLPVVVVIGHVDHGKTTLLDFIRKTRVAAKEKGGITQHLGAYEVTTTQGSLVFLDTPGHAAFSRIRGRGVKVADIAVLVVAADDSVMPQTIEAIKHAQAMGVPIIVAINKIDKAQPAQIEKVKKDLTQHGLVPEDWGGDAVCVPISAKLGQGVDELLEMIILQSQLMELRTDINAPAKGFILEAKLEKGRGPVATVICQQGILKIGDYFAAGHIVGKVSSLTDSYGKHIKQVQPSIPAQVAGFSELPSVGEYFEVVTPEKYRALRSSHGAARVASAQKVVNQDALALIFKADTNSSKEAVVDALAKIAQKSPRGISILHAGVGDISESDIVLATDTGALIFGLHVKAETNAAFLARKNLISLKLYGIIYQLLDEVTALLEETKEVKTETQKIGEAIVRKVFDIKGLGVIAGAYVKDGKLTRDGHVIIWRGKNKVGKGPIKSLQRERKTVKEIGAGFECAFMIEGFTDWQIDDRVECFTEVPVTSTK